MNGPTIGFASILLITLLLNKQGYIKDLNDSHIHDLGKFVFAFFYSLDLYVVSQFMLIWYANIPEEVIYHMERIELDNYRFLFWFSLAINFIIPALFLMSRDAKTKQESFNFCLYSNFNRSLDKFVFIICSWHTT